MVDMVYVHANCDNTMGVGTNFMILPREWTTFHGIML